MFTGDTLRKLHRSSCTSKKRAAVRYNERVPAYRRKVRRQHSAGGAVVGVFGGRAHVAMIATRGGARWGLPKGALNPGESAEEAALREVREETNLEAELLAPLDSIEYWFRVSDGTIHKRVDFFMMRYLAGELRPQLEEVDAVEWVLIDEAVRRASFDSERRLIEEVRRRCVDLADLEPEESPSAPRAV